MGAGACVVRGADRVVEVVRGLDVVAVEDKLAGAGEGEDAAGGDGGAGTAVDVGPRLVSGG
ncbi:MAG TPA: hypothetical protein VMY88_07865 [Acidimicrobiales bacterium]|nr:hypothetical protein [Acidimicrobiales bacterium]